MRLLYNVRGLDICLHRCNPPFFTLENASTGSGIILLAFFNIYIYIWLYVYKKLFGHLYVFSLYWHVWTVLQRIPALWFARPFEVANSCLHRSNCYLFLFSFWQLRACCFKLCVQKRLLAFPTFEWLVVQVLVDIAIKVLFEKCVTIKRAGMNKIKLTVTFLIW